MPIVSRKDFAEQCGDIIQKINVWITRGKIATVPGNKKQINTDDPVNSYFLAERRAINGIEGEVPVKTEKPEKADIISKKEPKNSKKATEKPVKIKNIPQKDAEKPVKTAKKEPEKPVKPSANPVLEKQLAAKEAIMQRKYDIDVAMKEQSMELRALNIQSEKIRLDKTAGNLLPVDLTSGVIERHANAILKTFEKGFERIAEIYSTMAGFAPGQRSEFLKECRMELGACVTSAGQRAQEEIETLVGNYAETLMRGQKKA